MVGLSLHREGRVRGFEDGMQQGLRQGCELGEDLSASDVSFFSNPRLRQLPLHLLSFSNPSVAAHSGHALTHSGQDGPPAFELFLVFPLPLGQAHRLWCSPPASLLQGKSLAGTGAAASCGTP